jgi:hypothetical protein
VCLALTRAKNLRTNKPISHQRRLNDLRRQPIAHLMRLRRYRGAEIVITAVIIVDHQRPAIGRADKSIRSEADLVRVKFAALQPAFKDAFSNHTQATTAKELRSIVLANYERLLAAEGF